MIAALPAPAPLRPPAETWTRRHNTAVLAGVCAVVARQLRIPVVAVRIVTAVPVLLVPLGLLFMLDAYWLWSEFRTALALAAPAVLGYTAAWWALPDDAAQQREQSLQAGIAAVRGRPDAPAAPSPQRSGTFRVLRWLALASLVGAAVVTIMATAGFDLFKILSGQVFAAAEQVDAAAGLAILVGMMGAAVSLGLMPLADLDRDRWAGIPSRAPVSALLALLTGFGGLMLTVFIAIAMVVGARQAFTLALVAAGVLALLALLLVPWARRLWSGLRDETEQRAVMAHHRETTAHLHDSVLQTLTVMQRAGTGADEMRRLARQQERELRRWLYRDGAHEDAAFTELRAAVEALSAQIEDEHGMDVGTVVVGDTALDERLRPLLGALREATVNACRHGREGVDVFVDIGPTVIQAFVRDRGPGFDLEAVPADRLGVRESVIGRMQRAGGTATVRPAPGGGTEVALALPWSLA